MRYDSDTAPSELLAVDIGNRTTCFGLFGEEQLKHTWTVTTAPHATVDEVKLSILSFMATLDDSFFSGEGIKDRRLHLDSILSCVVPDLTNTWVEALRSLCAQRPLVVGPGLKTGIQMKYNDPAEVGSDRIADIVAAKQVHGFPVVIIDCGMTINYAILDKDGAFVGGLIVPGISLSVAALAQAAARLPIVGLSSPKTVIGKNTRESMQSGIINGEIARIDGLIDMIWEELGYETKVILSGPDASLLKPLLNHDTQVDDTLTLKGLKLLYEGAKKR